MSAIQHRQNDIRKRRGNPAQVQKELQLRTTLKCTQASKSMLPIGALYVDCGGLTFVHSTLLPWVRTVEASMK